MCEELDTKEFDLSIYSPLVIAKLIIKISLLLTIAHLLLNCCSNPLTTAAFFLTRPDGRSATVAKRNETGTPAYTQQTEDRRCHTLNQQPCD